MIANQTKNKKHANSIFNEINILGYDLPMVDDGESEPEFEAILDIVDPIQQDHTRSGEISLQDYMAFMISKETENVLSSDEIVNAFQAITTQEREYITKEELYAHLTREMADYCLGKMKGYSDPRTGQEVSGAYDYMEFTRTLFQT